MFTFIFEYGAHPSPAKLFIKIREKHTKKTSYTNGFPDDEHMIFKTCRRHEKLN
jgi:hypothetical protein